MLRPTLRPVQPVETPQIGTAYLRLALNLEAHFPGLVLHDLAGDSVPLDGSAKPAGETLAALRDDAVDLATGVQNGWLLRNRRLRLLRQVRALLWLIRQACGEEVIFPEQVRFLLDVMPESVGEDFFQAAHDTLVDALPARLTAGNELAQAWQMWQAEQTRPAAELLPLLQQAMTDLARRTAGLLPVEPLAVAASDGDSLHYDGRTLHVPAGLPLRVDRLYHVAARWGHGGLHTFALALRRRHDKEEECRVILSRGLDQVFIQGLPKAVLGRIDLYNAALPPLLEAARLSPLEPIRLAAIHAAQEMLEWAEANATLLLHAEGLRPRAVRRSMMHYGLFSRPEADRRLAALQDPVAAAHVFARLVGGPLLDAYLAKTNKSITALLADPLVPSTMLTELDQ